MASSSSEGRRGALVYAAAVTTLTVVGHVSDSWGHHITAIAYVAAYVLTFPLCLLLVLLGWLAYYLLPPIDWLQAASQSVMFALAAYMEAVVVRRWIRQRQPAGATDGLR